MTSLPGEEIDKITLIRIKLPYREYFETSFGREYEKHTYLVIVEAGGEEGYAETAAGRYPKYSYEAADIDAYVVDNYIIPSIKDVPEIKVYFVEAVYPEGPFGAKGLGEPCLISSTLQRT